VRFRKDHLRQELEYSQEEFQTNHHRPVLEYCSLEVYRMDQLQLQQVVWSLELLVVSLAEQAVQRGIVRTEMEWPLDQELASIEFGWEVLEVPCRWGMSMVA
jgi:hypothetical protein